MTLTPTDGDETMLLGRTWSHRLVRPFVRSLIGTGVTPNHLTTLRLISGLAACLALMVGDRSLACLGGALWIGSLLLDYADGELARLGDMCTPGGHKYDYVVDNVLNTLFFISIGLGLRDSMVGHWAILFGLVSGASVCVTAFAAEALEHYLEPGGKAMEGAFGFLPEDLLYLVGPLVWLDWLLPLLIGAVVGAPIAMSLICWRLWKQKHC